MLSLRLIVRLRRYYFTHVITVAARDYRQGDYRKNARVTSDVSRILA